MKIISVTSRTVTAELDNGEPYFSPGEYEIYLNDHLAKRENTNVFTLFDLSPDTEYVLRVKEESVSFRTASENHAFHLRDFYPYADGVNDDTAHFQAAIMALPENSTLIIDEGCYLVTSVFLKSNMMLYFEKNARILASVRRRDYPVMPGVCDEVNLGVWEGAEKNNFASTINCIRVENVTIAGEGEIDGRAPLCDWYRNHRTLNIAYRGHSLFFNRCKNICVAGLFLHDTQAWAVHPYFTEHSEFYNLTITNDKKMPTTDGIDPDCCKDMVIKGCRFNLGDDCIAIKSGTIDLARKYHTPSENIIIENNLMEEGHGGVVFGSESSGGIEHVTVRKCIFRNTDRGLRIKTRRGRGHIGIISDITYENIRMENVKTPFVINAYYNMGPKDGHTEYVWTTEKLPVDERTPFLGHFTFRNMTCTDVSYAAGVFLGLPEAKIKSVTLENVSFTYRKDAEAGYPVMREHNQLMKKCGIYAFNVERVITKNTTFTGVIGDEIKKEES